jgi:hypothetical protein
MPAHEMTPASTINALQDCVNVETGNRTSERFWNKRFGKESGYAFPTPGGSIAWSWAAGWKKSEEQ